MRRVPLPLVLFLMLCAAGCADDPDPAGTVDLAVDEGQDVAAPSCTPSIGSGCASTCAADEVCATSAGGFNQHVPACLKKCVVSTDCAGGMICAELYGEMLSSAVCISATVPAACGTIASGYHCDFPPASCLDATTLLRPFSQASDGTCGHEHQRCATACVDAADGGVVAHCE